MLKIVDDRDCTYIVMDYYSNGDHFSNITEKGAYVGDDPSIRTAFLQIVDVIEHCHRLGIYYRDTKPENILVNGPTLAPYRFWPCYERSYIRGSRLWKLVLHEPR
jgi:serine/threonine protein kinase